MIAWIALVIAILALASSVLVWACIHLGGTLDRARLGKRLNDYEWSCMLKEANERANRKHRPRRQAGRVYR